MKEMCKYIKCDIAFEKRLISMPIKYCFFCTAIIIPRT